jgi:hypothetical protein
MKSNRIKEAGIYLNFLNHIKDLIHKQNTVHTVVTCGYTVNDLLF